VPRLEPAADPVKRVGHEKLSLPRLQFVTPPLLCGRIPQRLALALEDAMKVGVNSVLFGGYDMETAFRYVAACGYDGIEVSAIGGMSEHLVLERWQEIAPQVRDLSAQYALPVLAMEQPSRDPEKMAAAFAAAAAIDCPIVNCGPGGETGNEESFVDCIASLTELAKQAGDHGVTLCVKAHVGACIHDTPTSLRALEAIDHPAFGLDMDPSHIHRANENPVDAIAAVADRIRHVHIRDCRGRQHGPGKPEDQANGRGDIDLLGYIRVLHDAGYTGPVDLEVIGAKEYELPLCVMIAAETRGHLQASLQACGAR
jgi:sugar phosphate isomerase/epimerase